MRTTRLPDGTPIPVLGQGTWTMAERPERRGAEIASLRAGLDLGMTLVDTAEMYADGACEELVGEALQGRRDETFVVSKAYPHNASRARLADACEASLRRLRTDRLDLCLLHWRGGVPLAETVEAMERLVAAGKILRWGVSNLDVGDMEELVSEGGGRCQTNQVLYNLSRRGPEHDLLPWLSRRGMPVMAYSPVEQGRLLASAALAGFSRERGASPAAVALAWVLSRDGIVAIPKTGNVGHVRENRDALDLRLSGDDIARLDVLFPRPAGPVPLETL